MSCFCRKFSLAFLVLTLPLFLLSCIDEKNAAPAMKHDAPSSPSVKMEATVREVGERLLVEVTKSAYTSGPHVVLVNDGTAIEDQDGNPLTVEDIKVGDKLQILYSGQVMLSYPPQIVALRIIVNH